MDKVVIELIKQICLGQYSYGFGELLVDGGKLLLGFSGGKLLGIGFGELLVDGGGKLAKALQVASAMLCATCDLT